MIVDGFYDRSSSGYVVDKDGNIVRDIPFLEIIILSLAISFIIIVIVIGKTYKSNKTKKNNIIDNLDKNTVMIKLKSDKLVDTIVK
jgi:p-aminobenzoyl-glutamate transporter AbgT